VRLAFCISCHNTIALSSETSGGTLVAQALDSEKFSIVLCMKRHELSMSAQCPFGAWDLFARCTESCPRNALPKAISDRLMSMIFN
jgi:Fe-S-cluster-containing hydrogenase component 2